GSKQVTPRVRIGSDEFTFERDGTRYTPRWNGKSYDQTVRADNVVILDVRNRKDTDTTSELSVVSETVGQGKVTVHRNGSARSGTWKRPKLAGPMRLVDDDGRDLPLAPGRTWILLRGA
ncbi:MAG: DUF3048 C-terminal domain-containing protein, partial [Propionibacteriales bacterium]|nr:DUF3048 C-terminal domain-containing protein [Propionibacteriales bacterium]